MDYVIHEIVHLLMMRRCIRQWFSIYCTDTIWIPCGYHMDTVPLVVLQDFCSSSLCVSSFIYCSCV